jgi:UDP-glucose 4-epimerase
MKNKHILIIGGAGFIGSSLCSKLLKYNNKIVVLDNLLSGKLINIPNDITFIKNSAANILNINFEIKFDIVFHFGEYSRVEISENEQLICFDNTVATIGRVLEFCLNNKCKIIYSGSSTLFTENGKYLSPYTFYKSQNVETVKYICLKYRIPFSIVYFSNVYGQLEISEGRYATVIAKFLAAKKKNEKVLVSKPGTQARAFTHIDDTTDGIILSAEKGNGDGYVIGASKQYSIINICEMIGLEYELIDSNFSNRENSIIDTKKMNELGWQTKMHLPDYIKDLVKS